MPKPFKTKKVKGNYDILVKVEGWHFQTEIMMSASKPMKAHIIDQSLNESIDNELLFTTTCQSSSTGGSISFSQFQWQAETDQSKAEYKLHH